MACNDTRLTQTSDLVIEHAAGHSGLLIGLYHRPNRVNTKTSSHGYHTATNCFNTVV